MNFNLAQPFYISACKYPDKPAIYTSRVELKYGDALRRVCAVVEWLRSFETTPRRVGIVASRSADACIGILATAWIGATYVPINLALPPAGMAEVLKQSALDAVIADREGSLHLTGDVLDACPSQILAHRSEVPGVVPACITDHEELNASPEITEPEHVEKEAAGYIVYTSGSTGVPKGVVVPVGGVEHLLRVLDEKYALRADDRVAETAATSFDISVYNMFATWRAGAALHVVPLQRLMQPSKFIQDRQITMWFSVPSIATFMSRTDLLKPGMFPSLRQTFFCGEPLLGSVAEDWQKAAPHSTVVNMYGPTEATVMCTGEDYVPGCGMTRDIVAIGRPFEGMKAAVASTDLQWVDDGEKGELLLSGPQLAMGYLDDPEKTVAKFVKIDGERWYKTGDLALKDDEGIFHYLGRIDNQVKIRGYRIELEDIEYHLREASGSELVAAVAWPRHGGTATGLAAFVSRFEGDVAKIKHAMTARLPSYMVPNQIHVRHDLPLNHNGKVDRNALSALLAAGLGQERA